MKYFQSNNKLQLCSQIRLFEFVDKRNSNDTYKNPKFVVVVDGYSCSKVAFFIVITLQLYTVLNMYIPSSTL